MMTNNSFISIKNPCKEGWQNMSLSENGKFCSSCKKHVHDFSQADSDEIKKVYSESADGICGRVPVKLMQDQYVKREVQKLHFTYLKKFCFAAILCFGANLFTIDSAKAGTFNKIKTTFFNLTADSNKDTIVVRGMVKEKDSRALIPFVNIAVTYEDSLICTGITNVNGEYEVKIPKGYSTVDFKASYIGYETRTIKNIHISSDKSITVDIDLEAGMPMMMGDIDINYKGIK